MPVSPAHAGMSPPQTVAHACWKWFPPHTRGMYPFTDSRVRNECSFPPHTRGCTPGNASAPSSTQRFPPHTRGCTGCHRRFGPDHRVSPAHAGMYPTIERTGPLGCGFPPHTRGMYPHEKAGAHSFAGFPRTRGDVPSKALIRSLGGLFPPHTRGCTLAPVVVPSSLAVSPAHAGMYPFQLSGCRV